jgi:cytochrome c oxidase accessory protein FixG
MLADVNAEARPLPKFAPEELGDCIDCTICVQVCPTGIDIRNGLQYECIACGACIDACDEVMDKMGYPRGLIRYSTQNAIDGKSTKVARPRIIVYGLLLLGLCGAWAWGVTHRSELIADVLRDRNALYRETADGVANDYTLKLVNKSQETRRYRISLEPADAGLRLSGPTAVEAGPEQVLPVTLTVVADAGVSGRRDIRFIVESEDGRDRHTIESSFFGPTP